MPDKMISLIRNHCFSKFDLSINCILMVSKFFSFVLIGHSSVFIFVIHLFIYLTSFHCRCLTSEFFNKPNRMVFSYHCVFHLNFFNHTQTLPTKTLCEALKMHG